MTTYNISAIEFWLLDAVWQFRLSSRFFYRNAGSLAEQVNLRIPTPSVLARIDAAESLIAQGLLHAEDTERGTRIDEPAGMLPRVTSRNAIPFSIQITPLGGMIWERIAVPNWKRYVEQEWRDKDRFKWKGQKLETTDELLLFKACDEGRLAESIDYDCRGRKQHYVEHFVIRKGVELPWNVSTWKTLPKACWAQLLFRKPGEISPFLTDDDLKPFACWRRFGFNESLCDTVIDDANWKTTVTN